MSNGTVVCWFESETEALISMVYLVPTVVSFGVSVVGWVTSEVFFVLYGLFLLFMHFILLAIGAHVSGRTMIPDPLCPEHLIPGFPAQAAFYIASLATLVFLYALTRRHAPGILPTVGLPILFLAVPGTLIWFGFNTVLDTVFSLLAGCVATFLFFWIVQLHAAPVLGTALTQAPFSWLGYRVGELGRSRSFLSLPGTRTSGFGCETCPALVKVAGSD